MYFLLPSEMHSGLFWSISTPQQKTWIVNWGWLGSWDLISSTTGITLYNPQIKVNLGVVGEKIFLWELLAFEIPGGHLFVIHHSGDIEAK